MEMSNSAETAVQLATLLRAHFDEIHNTIGYGRIDEVMPDYVHTDKETGESVVIVTTISGNVETDFIVTGETEVIAAGVNAAFYSFETAVVRSMLCAPDDAKHVRRRWCIVAMRINKTLVDACRREKIPVSLMELTPNGTCQFYQCPAESNVTFATIKSKKGENR